MLYRLEKENPGKSFFPASEKAVCPNMKQTTLEKIICSLEEMTYEVQLSQEIISKANQSIRKMLEFARL
ncbi:MAG: quinolinate synthase NadA [Spirochaetota bacterium]|nr:quinolinate synthase NadA [Spirochaetota bacterium]